METHIFVANAPCVIQTSLNRYRLDTAGQILRLSPQEADQVRSPSFSHRDYLTYLGKEKTEPSGLKAIPVPAHPETSEPAQDPGLPEEMHETVEEADPNS